MNDLREQLRSLRADHRAARYPGDLAAEILPPARKAGRPWFFPAVAGAAAAAAAAVVVIAHRFAGPEPVEPAVVLVAPPATADHGRPAPRAYRLPDRMPLSLPAAPLVAVTPPVTVSLAALNDFRAPSYERIGPRIRERLNLPTWMQPPGGP